MSDPQGSRFGHTGFRCSALQSKQHYRHYNPIDITIIKSYCGSVLLVLRFVFGPLEIKYCDRFLDLSKNLRGGQGFVN